MRWGGGGGPAFRQAEGTRRHPTLSQTNKLRGRTTLPPVPCPHQSPEVCTGGGRGQRGWGGPRQGGCRKRGPRPKHSPSHPQSRPQPGRLKLLRISHPPLTLVLAGGPRGWDEGEWVRTRVRGPTAGPGEEAAGGGGGAGGGREEGKEEDGEEPEEEEEEGREEEGERARKRRRGGGEGGRRGGGPGGRLQAVAAGDRCLGGGGPRQT